MCGIAAAGLVLSGLGTATSFISSQQQSRAIQNQANNQANYAISAAQVRADQIRKAGLIRQGQARTELAGSGVDVNAGTSVEINRKIGENTEHDALTEILDGKNQAINTRTQATNQATGIRTSGIGTLITGGSQVLQGWKTMSDSRKVNT